MNLSTGAIEKFKEGQQIPPGFVPVNMNDATAKQKREKRVSLHDHRSKLGKVLTRERYRRLRKKGLLR
jgi:hypothetical protein